MASISFPLSVYIFAACCLFDNCSNLISVMGTSSSIGENVTVMVESTSSLSTYRSDLPDAMPSISVAESEEQERETLTPPHQTIPLPSLTASAPPDELDPSPSLISPPPPPVLISVTPSNTPISSATDCTEQVDQVSVQLSGVVTDPQAILNFFSAEVINQTNIYCSGSNRTLVCQLTSTFTGEYASSNFLGCYFPANSRRKRQTSSSLIRYFLTQPDNSNGTLNLEAMLEVTVRAVPAFSAATGLTVTQVLGVRALIDDLDKKELHLVAIIAAGAVGGVVLIIALILCAVVGTHLVIRLANCANKKNQNRVKPNSESEPLNKGSRMSSSIASSNSPETIHLTR